MVYVEIGCWAGANAEHVARTYLTHPQSVGIGIDPYPEDRAKYNVDEIKQFAADRINPIMGMRWRWIYEPSAQALRDFDQWCGRLNYTEADDGPFWDTALRCYDIDLLYIDGAHDAPAVLQDFVLAWPMLRVGSVVIFDDYSPDKHSLKAPHVAEAWKAILLCFGSRVRVLQEPNRQAALKIVAK